MMIDTTKGPIDETLLERRDGVLDNDHEHTTWVEYWLEGACVHRSVHVALKQGLGSFLLQGAFA